MGTEKRNIEWQENRPGIYKVNCLAPGCNESRHFAGPDVTMHQVLMGLREMGWVITRRYDQPGMKIFCCAECAKKGGAVLGAQVRDNSKPTGKVRLSNGQIVDLAEAHAKTATAATRKRRKPARKKPRRKATKKVRAKRPADQPAPVSKSQLRFTMD